MSRQEFIEKAWRAAVAVRNRGALISAPVVVAQAALESNYGLSALARDHNNLFGVKGEYKGHYVEYKTSEQTPDGTWYTTVAKFRSYPSWEEAFNDYASIIERLPWYADAADAAHSPRDFLKGILAKLSDDGQVLEPGWATDQRYFDKVWAIVMENNLLERGEDLESEGFTLLQVYDGDSRIDFEPIKNTIGTTNEGGMKLMVRVKPTTFWQRLSYLFSRSPWNS